MRQSVRLFIRLSVLCALIAGCWLLRNPTSESQTIQGTRNVTVAVTQLEFQDGLPPVDVQCTPALLNGANELAGFACALKNNTTKNITGISLNYAIVLENKNGLITKDMHSWTIESLIHPDFRENYKPIAPGTQTSLNAGKIAFGDATPKVIEISVDYVEFEDESTLGRNATGSKVIAEMKSGAALYKDWLVQQYVKKGKRASELASLIQTEDQTLPADLKLRQGNSNEEHGARAYRSLLRKLFVQKGPTEIRKYFPR